MKYLLTSLSGLIVLSACAAPVSPSNNNSPTPQVSSKTASPTASPNASPLPTPSPTPTPITLSEPTTAAVREALDALFAVDSRTKSGINYSNFSVEVANARVAVDKMNRQKNVKYHPSYSFVAQAASHYEYSKDIWNCYIEDDSTNRISNLFRGSCYNIYSARMKSEYGIKDMEELSSPGIFLPDALSTIWAKATTSLNSAQDQIDNPPLNTPREVSSSNSSTPATPSIQPSVGPKKPTISGVIRSERGNLPVNRARVIGKIEDGSGTYAKEVYTDSNGKYVLDEVPLGATIRIYAQKAEGEPGYCYFLQTQDIKLEQEEATVNITLPITLCSS